MFQLPQGGEKPQGSTDEDPIVLSGDTAEQFRALCWALYALPDEITKQSDNGSAMEKLIRVAVISHKYQLAAFQSWSMGSIRRQCKSTQWGLQHNKYLNSCPPALFPALFHLSVLYGDEGLTNRIINAWVQRLQASGSTSIPLSGFSDAFKAADENHNRPFLGQLYYARLQVAPVAPVPTTNPSFDFPFEDLEYRDLQRILRGSWGLSSYWQSLISSVPELPKDSRCQHHSTRCRPEWARMWGKATIHGSATDIRQKLDYINTSCVDPGTMTAPCAVQARALVRSFITKMEKTLPDFFLGPP
ncbi:hypothetical protein DFH06DRAFT_1225572 [Mycena polygramma]|nr:hypothetical protein DFH06DRAFT_1225572 [Mycena polygramma]